MTNKHHTVLYTGVTSDLIKKNTRAQREENKKSFTSSYNVTKLVYYKNFLNIQEAIAEEKRLKAGSRAKKIQLIDQLNPDWRDLWDEVIKW